MYIKNIFNIINYKGLEDNFKVEFADITYVIGDNAKNKTTIGSIPLWILTGYNLLGSNKEIVANCTKSQFKNTVASMTIIDNDGSEHVISRSKGADNFVMLDGIRTTQEIITRFYKDVHAFICSYNVTYFRSLELAKQRELLLRLLPAISSKEAFNLLEDTEKEILEKPVVDIKGFSKARRQEIKELNSELDKIYGKKENYVQKAIQKEEEIIQFEKQKELNNLEEEYKEVITDNIVSLEEIEKDINKLDQRIAKNIQEELKDLQEKQKKEVKNLESISSDGSPCPICRQQVKNENLIRVLTINYKKNINTFAEKIDKLKEETKELLEKRNLQAKKYELMKTPVMQEKEKRVKELKGKIDELQEEKRMLAVKNREIEIKHNEILDAKKNIEILDNTVEEINQKIELFNKQLKIVSRLNLLMMDKQMLQARKYLKNVSIEFNKIDEETGEILDVYNIKYDGREYEKLSKSYKIRADIEISNLINKITGINAPVFIDDMESVTEVNIEANCQAIFSVVVKYNELEILHSYPDVLQREKISINKKIEASNRLLQNAA